MLDDIIHGLVIVQGAAILVLYMRMKAGEEMIWRRLNDW